MLKDKKQQIFNEEKFIKQLKKEFRELNEKDFSKRIDEKVRIKRNKVVTKGEDK